MSRIFGTRQLAEPTGKAAARLASAVAGGSAELEPDLAQQRLQSLPSGTLHRLLEARGDGAGFRRGRSLPLELDLLVVDEVSMVDLPLMEALLAALPDTARLLLVGDPGQLNPAALLLDRPRHATDGPEPAPALAGSGHHRLPEPLRRRAAAAGRW